MGRRIALVNDFKTRIPEIRTLWHFLEEGLNAKFFSTKKMFWRYALRKYTPEVIIQNAFWGDLGLKDYSKNLITLVQDNYPVLLEYGMLNERDCRKHIDLIADSIRYADICVVIFPSMINSFNIPKEKAVRIPVGTDSDVFYPSKSERMRAREELHINGECNIFVGDETPIHGWEEVKDRIEENGEEYWILVSKNKPISLQKHNIRNFCNVDHNSLRALYNAADLFFARGHIGLPAIEAMFCGIPVDVSRTGYFEEWYPLNQNPRKEAINAGFELKDTLLRWKGLVSR